MTTCSHTGEVIEKPGCGTVCQGCTWQDQVSCQHNGSSCEFTWTVTRSGCNFSTDEEFTGTTTVPCGQTMREIFYCDSAGDCPGYKLTFTCGECPTPPGPP